MLLRLHPIIGGEARVYCSSSEESFPGACPEGIVTRQEAITTASMLSSKDQTSQVGVEC